MLSAGRPFRRRLGSLLAALPIMLHAQPASIVDEMVGDMRHFSTMATRTKQNEHYQPYVISVFHGDELEKLGITTLEEALSLVPGVDIATDNLGYGSAIFRGSNPFAFGQSKLLIDGVPANDVFFDGYAVYLSMPIELIKRIEVVRGPGSKADGINAYAGSINVITYAENFEGFKPEQKVFVRAGSFDARTVGFVNSVRDGDLALSVDGFYHEDDRTAFAGNDLFDLPQLDIPNGGLPQNRYAPLWLKNFSIGLSLHYRDFTLRARTISYQHGGGYGINNFIAADDDRIRLPNHYFELAYSPTFGPFEAEIKVGTRSDAFLSNAHLAPNGLRLPGYSDPSQLLTFEEGFYGIHEARQRTLYHSAFLKYSGLQRHRFRFGYRLQSAETYATKTVTTDRDTTVGLTDYTDTFPFFDPDAKRDTFIVSAEDTWCLSDVLSLMYGVNVENSSTQTVQVDPRISMVYQADRRNIFKAMYSRSHRDPSWQEMYTLNNYARRGNPALEPEEIDAFELAFVHKFSNDDFFEFNLFYLLNRDQIDKTNPDNAYRNTADTDLYGFEIEYARHFTPRDRFYANYAFVDGEDGEGHPLANVARHLFKSYYLYQLTPSLSLSLLGKYAGERERLFFDRREPLKDYAALDAALNYEDFADRYRVTLAIKNAFDAEIKYPSEPMSNPDDYLQDGRSVMLTFEKAF